MRFEPWCEGVRLRARGFAQFAMEDGDAGGVLVLLLGLLIVSNQPLDQLGQPHQVATNLAPPNAEIRDDALDVLGALVSLGHEPVGQILTLLDDALSFSPGALDGGIRGFLCRHQGLLKRLFTLPEDAHLLFESMDSLPQFPPLAEQGLEGGGHLLKKRPDFVDVIPPKSAGELGAQNIKWCQVGHGSSNASWYRNAVKDGTRLIKSLAERVRFLTIEGGTMDQSLEAVNLVKTYHPGLFEKPVPVLRGLSFEVRPGEVFGFLGPNGAGKTTAIKAITGLINLDEGEIRVGGLDHRTMEAKRTIGFMPESAYYYHHLTGREFLRFFGQLLGLAGQKLESRIDDVLTTVGMSDRADRTMRTFSKGMLQRVALGQALLGDPTILILDEPMSGLDPVGRRDFREIIAGQRDEGRTVFFSTHILADVETLCDRVAIIADGTVRAQGTVKDIVAQEAAEYEITFVGDAPASMDPERVVVSTDASWIRVSPDERDRTIADLVAGGAMVVGVSPVRSSLEAFILQYYPGGGA
jgi:ABC-2 type transport system ATP-binding protein